MGFDTEAFIRAVVISLATGGFIAALGYALLHQKKDWARWKTALPMMVMCLVILLIVWFYYGWPSLVEVPRLDLLTEDQANLTLEKKGLIPHSIPQHSIQVEKGLVIPKSQEPAAGQSVKKGRVVEYAISVSHDVPQLPPPDSSKSVTIFKPKPNEQFSLSKSGNDIYTGEVSGISSGIKRNEILLWIKPVNPASDRSGWYLQRHPHGISGFMKNGTWLGRAQIGNADWPPHNGDILDIAVSVVDQSTYADLMGRKGVVMSPEPVGNIVEKSTDVIVSIK